MSYGLGKEAALLDLADRIENGATFDGIVDDIAQTLDQDLEKTASAEETYAKLGIDAACYAFMKEASDIFGEYDVSESDEGEVLAYALEKTAQSLFKEAEEDKGLVGKARGALEGALGKAKEKATETFGDRGVGPIKANQQRNRNIGKGIAGTAALAAGAKGVHSLLKNRSKKKKKKKEEEGKETNASLNVSEDKYSEALAVLKEGGLLDD